MNKPNIERMLILNKDRKPIGFKKVTTLRDIMFCEGLGERGEKVIFLLRPANIQDIVEGA